MQREDERLKDILEGDTQIILRADSVEFHPLIYLYSDIKCAAVSEEWFSLIPVKER